MSTALAPARPQERLYLQNAVGYCRVSTEEQARNGEALKNQIARVREVIGPHAPLFTDVASRNSRSRPGFTAMLDLLDEGEVRVVVTARPDRLGHSQGAGCAQIYEWLHRKPSVVTKFLDFDLDLTSPAGRLLLEQLVAVSKFELQMMALRQRKNREVRMRSGETIAQPPFGYARQGYRYILDTFQSHCLLNERPSGWSPGDPLVEGYTNADLARIALKAVAKTGSYSEAARELEKYALTKTEYRCTLSRYTYDGDVYRCVWPSFPPVVSSLRNWCFNPAYRGHTAIRRNWDASRLPGDTAQNRSRIKGSQDNYEFFHENTHTPLLAESQWKKIVAMERRMKLSVNPAGAKAAIKADPFRSLLVCADCNTKLKHEGRKCQSQKGGEQYYSYYKCPNPVCPGNGTRIATSDLMGMLARRLARIARAVQAGEREIPQPSAANVERIAQIDELIEKMVAMQSPLASLDAAIDGLKTERRALLHEPDEEATELAGTGWQMLRQSKACNDSDWFVFLSRADCNLHGFLRRVLVGYESEQDRPTKRRAGGGRRKAEECGRPSIVDVDPL